MNFYRLDAEHDELCGSFTRFYFDSRDAQATALTLEHHGWLVDWYPLEDGLVADELKVRLFIGMWPNASLEQILPSLLAPKVKAFEDLEAIRERKETRR